MPNIQQFAVESPDVSHAIIEIFGGDNNLSGFVTEDLREMAAGIREGVSVIALADYADKGAVVVEVSPKSGIRVLENWGEINTGEPDIISEFLSRALATYSQSTRIAIGLWDHGSGVFDEQDSQALASKLNSASRYRRTQSKPARNLFVSRGKLMNDPMLRAILWDETNGGVLTNVEMRSAFNAAFQAAGWQGKKVDLVFSDACLNGMVEVLDQVKDVAEVVIASEDLEPGEGWEYCKWFTLMSQEPPQNAEMWARQAVEAFKDTYTQKQHHNMTCTLSAFRTNNTITSNFTELVNCCTQNSENGFSWLREARDISQAFARHDTYDIRDFAENLHEISQDPAIKQCCQQLMTAVDEACVCSEAIGQAVADAHGLAFWFPTSCYKFYQVGETYSGLEFNKSTDWVRYLESNMSALLRRRPSAVSSLDDSTSIPIDLARVQVRWGKTGHPVLAEMAASAMPAGHPLAKLLREGDIQVDILSLVPDDTWKRGSFGRAWEGPLHYADIDMEGFPANSLDPNEWASYYQDLGTDKKHWGCLPFRVWQVFDEMSKYAAGGDLQRFMVSAGIITHYVMDACMLMHATKYSHGDPDDKHDDSIHSDIEEKMIKKPSYLTIIMDEVPVIAESQKVQGDITDGRQAAQVVLDLMQTILKRTDMEKLVRLYRTAKGDRIDKMWDFCGKDIMNDMADGCATLARLWMSAWNKGKFDQQQVDQFTWDWDPRAIAQDRAFLPSYSLSEIAPHL